MNNLIMQMLVLLVAPLGVSVEQFLLISIYLMALILMAFDIRISALMLFLLNSVVLAFLYYSEVDYQLTLISLFISLAFMSISLLVSLKYKQSLV